MNSSCEVVFVPAPGIGHLVSTLEFAKRLMDRTQGLSATVLCLNLPFSGDATAYAKSLAASHPGIKLIDLPPVDLPAADPRKSVEHAIYVAVESAVPHVREALKEICGGSMTRVAGLVLDFFCMPLLDLAGEFGLDSYMFMTSNIGFVSLMMYLRDRNVAASEFDVENPNPIHLPGFKNPVPAGVLPAALFNKEGGYIAYIKLARRFRDIKGIIVNSFAELEGQTHLGPVPAIYAVGPVLDLKGRAHPSLDEARRNRIMKWLDDQPESSVVLLCFGSLGSFDAEQTTEIASGLEASGFRFLWCAKLSPPEPPEEKRTLEEILPEGFSGRVGERGVVFEGWAPQAEVLGHVAVGGFVSHCGWNSMLESLWHGIPTVAWPLYAEQRLNAFMMAKELGIVVETGAELKAGEKVVVKAEQICEAVQRVMGGESAVRERVGAMSSMARKAVADGGSSFAAIDRLIRDLLGSNKANNN